jgi:hypothetical protein
MEFLCSAKPEKKASLAILHIMNGKLINKRFPAKSLTEVHFYH